MDKDFSICYFRIENGIALASSLLTFAAEQFKYAKCITDIATLDLIAHTSSESMTDTRQRIGDKKITELVTSFAFSQLVDDVRIICCFENYMKACLLSEGYIIHNIEEAYNPLRKQQKSKPISVLELAKFVGGFKDKEISDSQITKYLPGINGKTISMSTLLKDGYQELIQLPSGVFETITKINARRNKLHFYEAIKLTFSNSIIKELVDLDSFVDKTIMPLQKKLSTLSDITPEHETSLLFHL
jgi:hypothetical protein